MRILIIGDKSCYDQIHTIKIILEEKGHTAFIQEAYCRYCKKTYLPLGKGAKANLSYYDIKDGTLTLLDPETWEVADVFTKTIDAVLILNMSKIDNGRHIGITYFSAMRDAFYENKKIYIYNPISTVLEDDIYKFSPVILNGDLGLIKEDVKE